MKRVLLTALIAMPISVLAQTVATPYAAHFREYGTRKVAGKMESFSREGMKAVNSQGQIFEGEYQSNGRDYKSETLYDPNKRTQYVINLSKRTAVARAANIKPFHTPPTPPVGSEVLGNIVTTIYPVMNPQTKSADGKIWVANGTKCCCQNLHQSSYRRDLWLRIV